jgi:hypothetical protein
LIPLFKIGLQKAEFESTIAGLLNSKESLPVYTHQRVDADAAFSVAAWAYLTGKRVSELDLHFVTSEDQIPEGVVALDVIKGIKGSESCCFAKLLPFFGADDNYVLQTLGTYLTKIDNHQKYEEGLPPGVFYILPANILSGLKMQGMADKDLCIWAEMTLLALIAQGERLQKSYTSALPPSTEHLMGGKITILPLDVPQYFSKIAFRQGADFVVYQDGFNIGILRGQFCNFNLAELYRELPEGFYLDPRGFMLAWGSKKFPKQTPSPLSAKELALRLVKLLGKKRLGK